ncbi:AMP-binding protein [Candidatus Sumerlaeota bacterium]|nr:AMP-binding protein [Candidatus Sumerlaeota bacterium]
MRASSVPCLRAYIGHEWHGHAGGTVFLHPRFEAGPVIEALKTKGITGFAGTPTMYFHILNHPASQGAKFPTLTRAGSGGAALPIEIRTAFRERFGVDVTEGYGMSETTVSACGYPEGLPPKAGSVGIPIPGTEMRVVDEAGKDVRIGEIGEIVCKGPNIMTGYYKNPEATAEALRDGWLYTGDLGYVDEKGYFSIVDRKKDMIIKGGYNIYPREIEEVIYELPEVNMAAVIGVPDLGKGEIPHALISVKPGMTLDPQKVMDRLGEKLAKYKLPESVRIVSEIPTGPTGKILKRELRAKWNEISGGAI